MEYLLPVSFSIKCVTTYLTAGFRLVDGDTIFKLFRKNLSDALQQVSTSVVIDFSECILIDSTALGVLVTFNQSLVRQGGVLKLRNLNENLLDVIKIAHLDRFVDVA